MIYAYTKHITQVHTVEMVFPMSGTDRIGTELATVDGITYVHIPDSETLPEQPSEITVSEVTLTGALKAEISAASPHVQLINQRVKEMIAQQYAIEDEIKLIRTSPSTAFDEYNTFVEACRQWGRDQKTFIGL